MLKIIVKTRIIGSNSSFFMTPINGLIRPIKITNDIITAICACTLFSFFNPTYRKAKATPAKVGISAVGEGDSEDRYPHKENKINISAFDKLIWCVFILVFIVYTETKNNLFRNNETLKLLLVQKNL